MPHRILNTPAEEDPAAKLSGRVHNCLAGLLAHKFRTMGGCNDVVVCGAADDAGSSLSRRLAELIKASYRPIRLEAVRTHDGERAPILGYLSADSDASYLDPVCITKHALDAQSVLASMQRARLRALRHAANNGSGQCASGALCLRGKAVLLAAAVFASPVRLRALIAALEIDGAASIVPAAALLWKGAVLGLAAPVQRAVSLKIFDEISDLNRFCGTLNNLPDSQIEKLLG